MVHVVPVHLLSLFFDPFIGEISAETMMSQNHSARDTIAGTNASPMNSVILKLPSLSASPNHLSPRTYLIVKRGENIA